MSWKTLPWSLVWFGTVPALAMSADPVPGQEGFLARRARAEAVIIIGQDSGPFYRWVASEVQRYVRQLSGAELPIGTAEALPPDENLIVLGGPKSNPLAAAAEQRQLVRFAGLKPDGFVLKTIELDGRPAVVTGGNDEAATMYAAYELLERLGIVFQLTNDIIPQQKPDLPIPALDVRMEPAFKHRGMQCAHCIRWYMGLADFRHEIDQLAKLKLNCLQFSVCMGGPWDYKAEPLQLDREELGRAIQAAEEERQFWDGRATRCGQALELMRQARPKVWPGSREELDYVIYKTENFITVFELLGAAQEARAAFDRALLARSAGQVAEVIKQLEQSRTALDRANRLVHAAAQQMIPYAHIPTERHILWIFNKAIPSHEAARSYLAEVMTFHKE